MYTKLSIDTTIKANTRKGCTDPSSKNFHFQANIDDGTCEPPNTNFTFGGVYQTCTLDPSHATENLCTGGPKLSPAQQVNPLTGDFSCPENYIAIKLHSGTVTHVTQKPVCHNVCHHCGWFSRCCQCQNVLTSFLSRATYEAYWCAALPGTELPEDSGYLFGGFYTSTASNPVTGTMSCPRFFYPLHMGEDIKVCVSTDYEQGYAYSVVFGGFESCQAGNPLADTNKKDNKPENWPHSCPHGFVQHLVAVDEGCEVNFCVHAGAFKTISLLPAKLPPFHKHPHYKVNVTDTLVVFGVYGEVWTKSADGSWVELEYGSKTGQALLQEMRGEGFGSGGPSSTTVGVSTAVGTLVLGALIILLMVAVRFVYKRRKATRPSSYSSLSGENHQINTETPA